LFYPYRNTLS